MGRCNKEVSLLVGIMVLLPMLHDEIQCFFDVVTALGTDHDDLPAVQALQLLLLLCSRFSEAALQPN